MAKKTSDEFGIERLKARLNNEHERLINVLMMELKNLHQRTGIAIESLKDGKALDVHLIINAGSVTESIARWNMVRDLIPYLYPELEKK
jgi:hypothetical protein